MSSCRSERRLPTAAMQYSSGKLPAAVYPLASSLVHRCDNLEFAAMIPLVPP